jgi:hypothetical protein
LLHIKRLTKVKSFVGPFGSRKEAGGEDRKRRQAYDSSAAEL